MLYSTPVACLKVSRLRLSSNPTSGWMARASTIGRMVLSRKDRWCRAPAAFWMARSTTGGNAAPFFFLGFAFAPFFPDASAFCGGVSSHTRGAITPDSATSSM
eukprot:9017919-Pyramimonas_sp.AAC.2